MLVFEGREARIEALVIAGWAGRDQAAVQHHIDELAALGVPPPSATPCFYRVAAANLTQAPKIQIVGETSSGEVEVVLLSLDDGLWLTVGSDHTDRALERTGVALSKQLCPKPIGTTRWRFEEVADHWDSLILRSEIPARLYQEGTLAALRPPQDLIQRYTGGTILPPGTAMFCGTLPVRGQIGHAASFAMTLEDPVHGRRLQHRYEIEALPVVG